MATRELQPRILFRVCDCCGLEQHDDLIGPRSGWHQIIIGNFGSPIQLDVCYRCIESGAKLPTKTKLNEMFPYAKL